MYIRFVSFGLMGHEMIESFDEYNWYKFLSIVHDLPPFHARDRCSFPSPLDSPLLQIIEDILLWRNHTHHPLACTQILNIWFQINWIIPYIFNRKQPYLLLQVVQGYISLFILRNLIDIYRLIDAARSDQTGYRIYRDEGYFQGVVDPLTWLLQRFLAKELLVCCAVYEDVGNAVVVCSDYEDAEELFVLFLVKACS